MPPSSEKAAATEETGLASPGPQAASDAHKNTGHLRAATVPGLSQELQLLRSLL